jgi:hypothetical protein
VFVGQAAGDKEGFLRTLEHSVCVAVMQNNKFVRAVRLLEREELGQGSLTIASARHTTLGIELLAHFEPNINNRDTPATWYESTIAKLCLFFHRWNT